jgi:hypothetical protein
VRRQETDEAAKRQSQEATQKTLEDTDEILAAIDAVLED